jgi:hypothetical protein
MDFLPKSAGFQAFGIFLAAALIVTMISVFNLVSMTRAARKLGKHLRDFAEKTRHSSQNPDYSPSVLPTEDNTPSQEQAGQNSKIASINSQTASKSSVSLSSTKQNNWVHFFLLLRYFLTTFPASETIDIFDLLLRRLRSLTSIPTVDSKTTSKAATLGAASTPAAPNPPPAAAIHTSKWHAMYHGHLSACRACSPVTNASAHQQSISHCGVGTNLLKVFLAAREGLHDHDCFSVPSNPPNPGPSCNQRSEVLPTSRAARGPMHRSRSSKSRGGLDQVSQLVSTATNRTDTENSGFSNPQSLHPQHLHSGASTQITMHKWIAAVASAFLVGLRVVLLPLWVVVLAMDYIVILAGLAALSVFADMWFEGEEDEEKKSSWYKRLIKWLVRPVWIIGREVKRG